MVNTEPAGLQARDSSGSFFPLYYTSYLRPKGRRIASCEGLRGRRSISKVGRVKRCFPCGKHQSTFKNEAVSIGRLGQTVKKVLHSKILEQLAEGTTRFSRLVKQTLTYRNSDVLRETPRHSSASRYGRITFSTLHTCANCMRSPCLKRFFSR